MSQLDVSCGLPLIPMFGLSNLDQVEKSCSPLCAPAVFSIQGICGIPNVQDNVCRYHFRSWKEEMKPLLYVSHAPNPKWASFVWELRKFCYLHLIGTDWGY